VPAFLRWTNAMGTGLADTVGNWQEQIAENTWTTLNRPLMRGDDLLMDGSVSNADVVGLHGFGTPDSVLDYGLVQVVNGYAGTVSLAADGSGGLSVIMLNLTSGAISQPAAGTELSVLNTLIWTGGALGETEANPSDPAFAPSNSVVNVMGSGTITLPTDGTLYCGSTLGFYNPTAAAVETVITGAGTLLLNGGLGVNVAADAKVEVHANLGLIRVMSAVANKQLTLNVGSEWGYVGTGPAELGLQVINPGGRFYLTGKVDLKLTGGDANTPAYTQSSAPFIPTMLAIQNGSSLDVSTSKGILINGGTVWLNLNADAGANQEVTIVGKFMMAGGEIAFQAPIMIGEDFAFSTFHVFGDVVWSHGIFRPGVDCRAGKTGADQWWVSGTMTIETNENSPRIEPEPRLVPAGQGIPQREWEVIRIIKQNEKIDGNDPNVPQGWNVVPVYDANGVKERLKVKYVGS
jgi:hypothetical protein